MKTTRRHRWWIYVGIGLGGVFLLIVAAYAGLILLFTSNQPMVLTRLEVTQEDRNALTSRWLDFQEQVEAGAPAPPFRASARDLNVFFSMLPRFADAVHLSVLEDRVRAEFSIPLSELLPGLPRGRYLNGEDIAMIKPVRQALPRLEILSATVNGRRVPRWILRRLSRADIYGEIFFPLENPEFLKRIDRIEFRDGWLVITPVEEQ